MITINLLRASASNPVIWGIPMKTPWPSFLGRSQSPITGIGSTSQNEKKDSNQQLSLDSRVQASVQNLDNGPNPIKPSLSYSPSGLGNPTSEHVLSYLADAESREPLVWLRDDIRIAWLTVLACAEGKADPWRYAFWMYLGAVPEKIIPQLVARAEAHRLMEVPDYDPTAKPVRSVAFPKKEGAA